MPGIWWLDAVVSDVSKPAVEVAEVTPGSFEVHVVRGESTGRFVVWTGTAYSGKTADMATRAKADAIWAYIESDYEIVVDGSVVYNGLVNYNSEWTDRGQLGID